MVADLLRILAATVLLTVLTLLPFLPGRYDNLAVPLSAVSQLAGTAGLVLVPFGLLWLAVPHSRALAGRQRALTIATVIAASLVVFIAALAGAIFSGVLLGVLIGLSWLWAAVVVWRRLAAARRDSQPVAASIGRLLVIGPIAVFVVQTMTVERMSGFSRARVIQNSAPLIAELERYRATHGRYPVSLLSVNPDYRPGVIGIERFLYEPHGDSYNLLFEHPASAFDTRELIVFNPAGGHVVTSHDMDLLQFTGEPLERRRGFYASRDLPHQGWKVFLFD